MTPPLRSSRLQSGRAGAGSLGAAWQVSAAILLGVAILVIGTDKGKIKDAEDMSSRAGTALASKKDPGSAETRAVPTIPRGTSSPNSTETVTNEEIDRGYLPRDQSHARPWSPSIRPRRQPPPL